MSFKFLYNEKLDDMSEEALLNELKDLELSLIKGYNASRKAQNPYGSVSHSKTCDIKKTKWKIKQIIKRMKSVRIQK